MHPELMAIPMREEHARAGTEETRSAEDLEGAPAQSGTTMYPFHGSVSQFLDGPQEGRSHPARGNPSRYSLASICVDFDGLTHEH
jgi:hypothetical protein